MPSLLYKLKHSIVSLRVSILLIVISLFLATTLLILSLTSIRFYETLTYTSLAQMNYASVDVLRELNDGLKPTEIQSQFTANLIQEDIIDATAESLIPYMFYLLKTMPLAERIYWADEKGNYVDVEKQNDHTVISAIYDRSAMPPKHSILRLNAKGELLSRVESTVLNFDPRQQLWYQKTKQAKKITWTEIFKPGARTILGITASAPAFELNNTLKGMFGISISLNYLSQFLTHQHISQNGYSFIITDEENLVAFPLKPPFIKAHNQPIQPIDVHVEKLPIIDDSIDYYKLTGNSSFNMKYAHKHYLINYYPVTSLAEYGWLIGVIVPQKDFTGAMQKFNFFILGICLVSLFISILLISSFIKRIVRPIHSLVDETDKIKRLDLEEKIHIPSRIKEVIQLRDAMSAMKIGLKSFQKYVPKTLVRQLIESGEDIGLGGTRRELVVLFTDIANFTTISEHINANDLMLQLCDYFEVVAQVVLEAKGTIDKYIGDSMMVFWGAPFSEQRLCHHAAAAALKCQEKINQLNGVWASQNKPVFITRIGIHLGEAIVGNIGSSERLNYTALGDTVNTANRIEEIGRYYHTPILVSDVVYEQIKNDFVLRLVDCVTMKGKTKSILIYELLNDRADKIPFDIISYNKFFTAAFSAYKHQSWDEAMNLFNQCLIIYPTDYLANLFIERCNYFKQHPPSADWNGVFKL